MNNIKMITITNQGNIELFKNMIVSFRKHNTKTSVCVYATESVKTELNDFLTSYNVEFKLLDMPNNLALYGREEFKQITFKKFDALINELKLGNNVLLSDCDVVFTRDPIPYLEQIDIDFVSIFQTDHPVGQRLCSGYMLTKNSQTAIDFYEQCRDSIPLFLNIKSEDVHDQTIINNIAERSKIIFYTFPTNYATNGHLYFSNKGPKERLNPAVIHTNFCIGRETKINFLKSEKLWYI